VYLLFEKSQFRLPFVPPALENHGNLVVSLGELCKWLAGEAEKRGVLIATETPAQTPLVDGTRVLGGRTGGQGIDKQGRPKPTYQPGAGRRAKRPGPRGGPARPDGQR